MEKIENFVIEHKKLLKIAQFARSGGHPNQAKFVKIHDVFPLVLKWTEQLPNDFDVIIGVPRSGLFIANLIASKLGRPLSTPDNFIRGEIWSSHDVDKPHQIRRILLVEDSIGTGNSLIKAREKLAESNPNLIIKTASFFVERKNKFLVDFYYRELKLQTIAEWTLLTNSKANKGALAVDMDGVLCEDCSVEVDSDEIKYLTWLKTAKPYLIPQFEITAIITSRLEKYRPQTEEWLKEHEVKYKKLCMMNLLDKKEKNLRKTIDYKIELIKTLQPSIFWESNIVEAQKIHKKIKIPILCTDQMIIFS